MKKGNAGGEQLNKDKLKQVVWLLVWDCFSRESGRYNFVDSDSYRGSYFQ